MERKARTTVRNSAYIHTTHLITPLGVSVEENFSNLLKGISAVKKIPEGKYSPESFYGAVFAEDFFVANPGISRFDQLITRSTNEAISKSGLNVAGKNTLFILTTTKGNIELLGKVPDNDKRLKLNYSACYAAKSAGITTRPSVISNACISGTLGIITGARLIKAGYYDNVVVTGADVVTPFTVSGFQSFKALSSDGPAKPFDKNRNGLSMGEGAGTIILSAIPPEEEKIIVSGGATSNDANHISGPSRTGEELAIAIKKAMKEAEKSSVDFLSPHATGTVYNDEMESKAFTLNRMNDVPISAIKGATGHTLGAAGILEAVIGIETLRKNILPGTIGYEKPGTPVQLNITNRNIEVNSNSFLKCSSGFGGCNAAVIFEKWKK